MECTAPDSPGSNGNTAKEPTLETNGTGGQEAAADDVQILGESIEEQVTEGAAESFLDMATGETDMAAPDTPVPEGE